MVKRKLQIGIGGLGRFGWDFHCKKLARHPEFNLVAVADKEKDRCAAAEKI